jgi:anti-sigma factor (TIGR02949 family)
MRSDSEQIDCQGAARRLHELLDGELTQEVEAAVRRHLVECAACMAVFEFEEAFKRFLAMRARSTRAPEDLRDRIMGKLDVERQPPAE